MEFETLYLQAETDGTAGAGNSSATQVRDPNNPETNQGVSYLRPGLSGTGYVDYGSAAGDSFTYAFQDELGGERTLHVRYATNGDRPLEIVVNGTSISAEPKATTPFSDTDPDGVGGVEGFDRWQYATFDISTVAGENTVTLRSPGFGGAAPNVDALAVSARGATVSLFAPEIASDAFTVEENTTAIGQVAASDLDGTLLSYSVSGPDADKISIDDAGNLSFDAAPDFEANGSAAGTNTVDVSVTDGIDTTTKSIAVSLTDDASEGLPTPAIDQRLAQTEAFAITPAGGSTAHRTQANGNVETGTPGQGGDKPLDQYGLRVGYSGTGYTDFGSNPGDAVTTTLNVAEAGLYDLHIRYATSGDRPLDLTVGGTTTSVNFGGADFAEWVTKAVTVDLAAGDNTVSLAIPAGRSNGPNVDALALTSVGATVDFPAANVAPAFTDTDTIFAVDENGTAIADVVATDADGDVVTYALSGDDADAFSISDAGTLSFKSAADAENPTDLDGNNAYEVTIEVSDGTMTSARAITVNVQDVNETAPNTPPTADDVAAQTEASTAVVIELADLVADAEDSDADLTITPSSEDGTVALDGTTLTFTPNAGFAGDATIAYTVSDTSGAMASGIITVAVAEAEADVDQPATVTLTPVEVEENAPGAVVVTIDVVDPDTTWTAPTLTLGGADAGRFEIAELDGALVLKLTAGEALDAEAPAPEVFVTAGGASSAPLAANVTDVAEPLSIDFAAATIVSYTSQDKPGTGDAVVSDDGGSLTLDGNLWKRVSIGQDYTITEDTKIELTLRLGTPLPEIVAVGFDLNETFSDTDGTIYKLAGSQTLRRFVAAAGTDNGDGTTSFTIDLSAHAGRTIGSLVFISDDDDASDGIGAPTFSNVRLVEAAPDAGGNAAPRVVGGGVADQTVSEGGSVEIDLPFVDDDAGPQSLSFTVSVVDGSGADVSGGIGLVISDGILTGTVGEGIAGGDYTITVTATDGTASASDAFTLTVENVNEAPIADTTAAFEPIFGRVGQEIAPIDTSDFTGAFSDPDAGDTLTFTVQDLPAGLSFSEGVVFGTPSEAGSGSFTIVATDKGGLTAELPITLALDAPEVGETTFVEAEAFTGLGSAQNFFATAQPGASGDQLIRVSPNQAGSVSTDLGQNGVVPGWHEVLIDIFDETDGSATFSVSIGDTVLAENLSFDSAGEYLNPGAARGGAGQPGNLKRISFSTPVLIESDSVLVLTGQADGEILRVDRFGFTRVEEPNAAPSATTLSASAVAENDVDGAAIGTLSATDPDGDDGAITFSVPAESPFEVVGNELRLKAGQSFDFEATPTVDVVITATDATGARTATTLTITVTDVNEVVGAPVLAAGTVEENAPGAVIGILSASDPDGDSGSITFSVADDRFEVVGDELRLKSGEALDFETAPSVTVEIAAGDGVNAVTGNVTFDVVNVNDAPTLTDGAALADVTLATGAGGAIDLSALGAADQDVSDTPTYAIASASPLPEGFAVVGTDLVVPADAPAGTYRIEVFATDGELDSESVSLTVTVGEAGPFEPFAIQAESGSITLAAASDANSTQVRDPGNPESNPNLENGLRPGFSGTGYVDFGNDGGDTLTLTVSVPRAGDYDLNVRYASSSARPLDFAVNGATTASPLAFSSTDPDGPGAADGFDNWLFETRTVSLRPGENTITLAIPAGATTGPNIDRIEITEAGTGPIPGPDLTADEGDDLAASTRSGEVGRDELDAVEFRLAGVDADIETYEVSTDGGATFTPVTAVTDGGDRVITLDLSAFAGQDAQEVTLRVTDGAGNTADTSATIAIGDQPAQAFSFELQLEDRSGAVTILDDTGGGTNNANLTQQRDAQNPEAPDLQRGPDGLWDDFTGDGYLDMGLNVGDAFAFKVNAPAAGTYSFAFRYANGGAADRPMSVAVGGTVVDTVPFAPTSAWDQWGETTVEVELAAGPNTITVANTIATGPNLDRVRVTSGVETVDPGVEPGPRETIAINFQGGAAPKAQGYLVDNFEGFADRGNGQSYGWVTQASAIDADGTQATPIDGSAYPAIAINERNPAGLDPRLQGYAHFDLGSYPERTAWELALEDGWYEVTVSVGDTGGPNDSNNRLFVEGELATAWTPTDAFKSQLVTAVAQVTDGFLTLSAQGGTITEMQYLEVRELPDLTPGDDGPAPADYASFFDARAISGVGATEKIVDLDPGDGARPEGVDPTADIFLGINVVEGRGGALLESLSDGSVRLYETLTGKPVTVNVNTTGGFDSLTISPSSDLKPFTSYTLSIDGFQDRGEIADANSATREFQRFTTSFVTGEEAEVVDREVAFNDTVEYNSNPVEGETYTSIEVSPDGQHLYVASFSGAITRWDIDPASGGIIASTKETFSPGDSFSEGGGRRGIIGLTFDPEDASTIWITDNYPIPLSGRDDGVPDFSGRISKATLGSGDSLADASVETFAYGLPRSNGDHVTNSLEFRAVDGSFKLYLIQGSNSAMGEPDSAWGLRPERLLNAAVMEIDHKRTPPEGGFDLTTEPLPNDGKNRRFEDTDNDFKNGGILIENAQDSSLNGRFLHFDENGAATVREGADAGSALVKAFYDPFASDAPVTIFATGQRNAYDLVWHSNGFLYVPTNGSAAGGNTPDDPATAVNERTLSVEKQDDYLFRVVEGKYYGHPNPLRDEYILNEGEATNAKYSGTGVQPDPNYDDPGSYSLSENRSPNGAIEYLSDAFGTSLKNAVLFTEYSGGDDVRAVRLGPDGTPIEDFVLQRPDGSTIKYIDPLDVTQDASGRVYLLTLNRGNGVSQIVRLDPAPGGVATDTTADEGGDLALVVIDASDPANVVFAVQGLDADIDSIEVSFNDGAAQAVTLDGGRFTRDLSALDGAVTARLTVGDEAGNSAGASVSFTAGEAPEGEVIDVGAFRLLDTDSGSLIRLLGVPSTHETNVSNDADGDGLNDGYTGAGYLDPNGGAEDKASFAYTAAAAGTYTLVFRLVNGSTAQTRALTLSANGETAEIADTRTGSFSTWQDFAVTLRLEQGPNTVVITQAGTDGAPNIDRVTITPDELDTPAVPNDGTETVGGTSFVVYEAENAALDGAIVVTEDRDQRGAGFVDFNGTADQSITWTIAVDQDGSYALDFLYALSTDENARPMTLSVDGTTVGTLPFVPNSNATEDDWGPQRANLNLTAGVHEITVTAPGANGPNLDYLRISAGTVDVFDPSYAAIDGEGRIELEATDDTTRTVSDTEVEFYFTVGADGVYALDVAANAGVPDGGAVTAFLTAGDGQRVELGGGDFPGVGDAGETTLYTQLAAGTQYKLTVVSDTAGAIGLDYLDVRSAPGDPDADIEVQSLDPAFYSNRLHFSFLENDSASNPDRSSKSSALVEISNSGTDPLEFREATITGPFELADPAVFSGLTLAPGASIRVEVLFDDAAISPKPNSGQNSVYEGALRLSTNDADTPVAIVDLAGFWQARDEGGQEPNVNEIWQLFGFGNFIEGLKLTGGGENSVLSTNDVFAKTDETEVLSPYWKIADGVTEAKITQIAAFHGDGGASIGIHGPGDKGNANDDIFWNHVGNHNQRVLPLVGSSGGDGGVGAKAGGFATATFDRGDIPDGWDGADLFGIEVAGLSTDPRLNPRGGVEVPGEQQGHTVKMFQAVDAWGNAIENVFLGIMDYTGINYDYNDNLFIIEGVAPVGFGASVSVSGLDDAAADDRLVFTNIGNPNNANGLPQNFRNEATFTLRNEGIGSAEITGLVFGGNDAGAFEIVGTAPTSIPEGGSAQVTVRFVGTDPVDDNAAVLLEGTLTVETNAGTSQTIALAGLAQLQSEAGEEPSAAQIVEALGYGTDVAQGQLKNGGIVETVGDEVLVPYLRALDGSKPVEVIDIAAFLNQGNISRLSRHDVGDAGLTELYAADDQQGQTVLPDGLVRGAGDTGSVARASFDGRDPFGLKITVDGRPTYSAWTDPDANVRDPTFNLGPNNEGHYLRFFTAKDASGNVIPGRLIALQDYPGGANFDYNDHMFVIDNVRAYDPAGAEDADGNGVIDALETDADGDGLVAFFDADDAPAPGQAAFNDTGTPWAVDGDGLTLLARLFDEGGQGVAYNDDGQKQGNASARPGTNVDISNGTLAVGYTNAGEWLEYTIDLAEAGTYELVLSSSSPIGGRLVTAALEKGGSFYESAQVAVPDTDAYTTYANTALVTLNLQAGVQVLRLTFDNNQQDLLSFTLAPVAADGNEAPTTTGVSGAPQGTEDEAYSFDVSAFFSDPDGDALSYALAGAPAGLTISTGGVISGTPEEDGDYTVTVIASDGELSVSSGFGLTVAPADEQPVVGQQPFPGPRSVTNGTLSVAAVNYDDGGQGVAYNDAPGLTGGSTGGRPGSDVEITGGGDVGWISAGEWLEYTIEVPEAGSYDFDLLLATPASGRSATVDVYRPGEGAPYASTGSVANPSSGSYTNFQPRSGDPIALEAGTQVVRVTFAGGSQDFRGFTVNQVGAPQNQAPTTVGIGDRATNEGQAFSLDVSDLFADPDGDDAALAFTATGLPAGFSISSDGSITGTAPLVSADTPFDVTVTATDGGGLSTSANFTLTVADLAAPTPLQTPFPGPNAPVLGRSLTVDATNFDAGGQGVSWNDDPGRDGGNAFRGTTDVELVGSQNDIGYVEKGEWVEYTVNVAEAGTYDLSVLAKTPIAGNSVSVSLGSGPTLASFALPDSNGSSKSFVGTSFASTAAQSIALNEGEQTLRFTFDGSPSSNGYLLDMRSFSLEAVEDAAGPQAIGEAGTVTFTQASSSAWQSVTFKEALDNPAVVMGPISVEGAQPGTMRVRNVTDTGFQYQLDEWDYLDGAHTQVSVSWMAMEKGVHSIGGQTVVAGTGSASGTKSSLAFGHDFGVTPVVMAQVTSTRDRDAVTDRVDDVTSTVFAVALDEQESKGLHGSESLSWIAMAPGGSPSSGLYAARTADAVTSSPFTFGFGGAFQEGFAFLADMQTEDGNDPATVRLQALDSSSARFFIEEETSKDAEIIHTTEEVGILGVHTGSIFSDDPLG